MSGITARNVVGVLTVLLCITALTIAAFAAIHYFNVHADIGTMPLAVVAIVFGTLLVRLVLLAVDNWIERAEGDDDGRGP